MLCPLEAAQLPLFLRNRFMLLKANLFGSTWTLALEKESWERGTPGEYENQVTQLQKSLKSPVALVVTDLPSNSRNRMVQKGIPFIVPGTQCFLPAVLVDLRERFPRQSKRGSVTLTPTAQLLLLYHLQRETLTGLPLNQIAEKLGCSAMMMSKVKDELEEAEICEVERMGRSIGLKFLSSKRELWKQAKLRLKSPVQKIRWAQWNNPGYPALLAGFSALSRRSMINDDRILTYALGPRMLESWLEKGTLVGCPDAESANVKIEAWSYEPKLLGDKECVDALSLYLSLQETTDERVQHQLEKLIEEIPW